MSEAGTIIQFPHHAQWWGQGQWRSAVGDSSARSRMAGPWLLGLKFDAGGSKQSQDWQACGRTVQAKPDYA